MKAAIFTGSRKWLDRTAVRKAFDQLRPDLVIEGGADGLDTMSRWECLERSIRVITIPADWKAHGRAAGPIRNKKMLDKLLSLKEQGYEISVHAFPLNGGKGTQSMMKMAELNNVPVRVYRNGSPNHPFSKKSYK